MMSRDPFGTPEPWPRTTTRIVTVSLRGVYQYPYRELPKRVAYLKRIVQVAAARTGWQEIDAVLFPGGFLRTSEAIGQWPHDARRDYVEASISGKACIEASMILSALWPGAMLVVGIDSEPVSWMHGGDQFISAWCDGLLVGLARKAFPVAEEVHGDEPSVWLSAQDAGQSERIIELRHGQRALLLACYDAFAIRARFGKRFADLKSLALLRTPDGRIGGFPRDRREQYLQRWLHLIDHNPPDVGLIAIHEFDQAGRDGYWQRHGIAGASAAIRGAPMIGAAHFKRGIPRALDSSTLAARDVPLSHLWQGTKRLAHRLAPTAGFILPRSPSNPEAIIRLFITEAQGT